MKPYIYGVIITYVTLTACSSVPEKPDKGMSMIDTTQLYGEKNYTVGKIIAVISSTDGKTFEYPSMPNAIQVTPGKYVIKHLCFLSTDGRANAVINKKKAFAAVEEVELHEGDILFVKSDIISKPLYAPNGRFIGNVPDCTHTLMTTNPDKPSNTKKYL